MRSRDPEKRGATLETVEVLLEHGADVNASTPLSGRGADGRPLPSVAGGQTAYTLALWALFSKQPGEPSDRPANEEMCRVVDRLIEAGARRDTVMRVQLRDDWGLDECVMEQLVNYAMSGTNLPGFPSLDTDGKPAVCVSPAALEEYERWSAQQRKDAEAAEAQKRATELPSKSQRCSATGMTASHVPCAVCDQPCGAEMRFEHREPSRTTALCSSSCVREYLLQHDWPEAARGDSSFPELWHQQHGLLGCDNALCNAVESMDKKFKACSRCRCAVYCSTECQKKHWKVCHRKSCCDGTVKILELPERLQRHGA